MALLYSQIPSAEIVWADGGLSLIATKPETDRLLIIGPAVDGPNEAIVSARNVADLAQLYGPLVFDASNYVRPSGVTPDDYYNGNALLKGYNEASTGGGGDIYLLRIGGTKATATHTNVGTASGTILAEAVYAGRIYNQASVTFVSGTTSGSATVAQAASKGSSFTITYSGASSGLTIRNMIDRINTDARNRSVVLSIGTIATSGLARNVNGTFTLTGGLDGTQYDDTDYRENLYTELTASGGTFDFLEDSGDPASVVVFSGLYADDQVTADGDGAKTTTSLSTAFANYLARRSQDYPQLGVIGLRPLADHNTRAKVATHAAAIMSTTAGSRGSAADRLIKPGYFLTQGYQFVDAAREMDIDAGGLLQTVAADVIFSDNNLGNYIENFACFYAGFLSRLAPASSPTNTAVRGISSVAYLFSKSDINTMSAGLGLDTTAGVTGGGCYVTLRQDAGVLRVVRGVTSAKRSSDFREVQTLRIVQAIQRAIRNIAVTYLGKPNSLVVKQSLETQVRNVLSQAAIEGSILGDEGIGYTVSIVGGSDSARNLVLGLLTIDVTIVPSLEIRQVTIRVKAGLAL